MEAHISKILTQSILTMVLLLILSACGEGLPSDNGAASSSSSSTPNSNAAVIATQLSLSPQMQTLAYNKTLRFSAAGGVPPYSYFVSTGNGGVIDGSSGLFTSPNGDSTVSIGVRDARGENAFAVVMVASSGTSAAVAGSYSKVLQPLFSDLAATGSHCSADNAKSPACQTAVHRYCQRAGYGSGYGPVEYSPSMAYVVCLLKGVVSGISVSADTLAAIHSDCDGMSPGNVACASSVKRYCQSKGFGSGFGPVEYANGTDNVVCVVAQASKLFDVPVGTLASRQAGCGVDTPYSNLCSSAANRECHARGYTSGFGILEVNASTNQMTIACTL
jgi:hypothetical protein